MRNQLPKTIVSIEIPIKYLLKIVYKCITYFNNSNSNVEFDDEFLFLDNFGS